MLEKTNKINRRSFIYISSLIALVLQMPVSACKRLVSKTEDDILNENAKETLKSVLMHLFPKGEANPSADELNSSAYIEKIYYDKNLLVKDKRLIKNGIRWVEETAVKLFDKKFILLQEGEKEQVLRDLENYRKGRRWLSHILTYLLESLLGDPVYHINTKEQGWKWLEHIPGSPRPTKKNIYEAG